MTCVRGRLLDLCYGIAVADDSLGAHLREVYTDSQDEAVDIHERFELTSPGPDEFVITRDGERIASSSTADRALGKLHWHVNRRVVATSQRPVLVHAGALELAGRGVIVVGASGAGKSTATASLAIAGLGYLTDDITAVESDGRLAGAAKPIGLRAPSLEILRLGKDDLQSPPAEFIAGDDAQRFVAASSLGTRLASSAEPGLIVFLSPELPGGTAQKLRRSQALARLTEYAFDLDRGRGPGFVALAELVSGSTCWAWGRSTADELVDFVTTTVSL